MFRTLLPSRRAAGQPVMSATELKTLHESDASTESKRDDNSPETKAGPDKSNYSEREDARKPPVKWVQDQKAASAPETVNGKAKKMSDAKTPQGNPIQGTKTSHTTRTSDTTMARGKQVKTETTNLGGGGDQESWSEKLQYLLSSTHVAACAWFLLKALYFIVTLGPSWQKQAAPWLCLKFQLFLGLASLIYGFTQTDLFQKTKKQLLARKYGDAAKDGDEKRKSLSAWDIGSVILFFYGAKFFFGLLNFATGLSQLLLGEDSLLCFLLTIFLLSIVSCGWAVLLRVCFRLDCYE